jgi:hypothetical protein
MNAKYALITGLLACVACRTRDGEVIRHLVIAEVAEKQSIEPQLVKVTSMEIRSKTDATAKAEYAPLASRGERVELVCRLTRKLDRWHVDACALVDNGAR